MNLLPHLTRLARVSEKASDADLLSAFVNRRDGDAFAALVRRHAGMVWSVCRRWLRDPADAEDAFQATFLVLVRRAATIDRPNKLANWLYGVAIRAARKLRDRNARLRRLEENHSKLKRADADLADPQDLCHLLDEELQRLPEKYRLPVVLCHLRGLSRREAARLVGCPEGTLSTRIARALVMLRSSLIRRGLAPAALAALAPAAADAAPRLLVRSTVAVALCSSLPAIPDRVSQIAEGVIQMLFLQKVMRATASAVVLAGVVLVGGFLLTKGISLPAFAGDPPAKTDKPAAPPSLTVRVITDENGALKQLVVAEDEDESTMTTTRALSRYLKRAKRERPTLEVTVAPSGKVRPDVLSSVSDACRESGFAHCKIKPTANGEFELVQINQNLHLADVSQVYLDQALLSTQLHPYLIRDLGLPQANLIYPGASLQLAPLTVDLGHYRSATMLLQDPTLLNQVVRHTTGQTSLDGKWSVRELIGANKKTTYDAGKNVEEWVITGDYLIHRNGNSYRVGKIRTETKGDSLTVDYMPDAAGAESHHGTYTLKGDTLTVTFPGSVLSGGTDKIVLERVKPEAKAQPAPAKKSDPAKK